MRKTVLQMNRSTIDALSETFLILMPLIQKKVFDSIAPEEAPPVQLPGTAGRVLVLLREIRSSSASELCRQLDMARPNMTAILDLLEKSELIIRRSSETDRRITVVEITSSGEELCDSYTRIVSKKFRDMLQEVEPEELDTLLQGMTKMKEVLLRADKGTASR